MKRINRYLGAVLTLGVVLVARPVLADESESWMRPKVQHGNTFAIEAGMLTELTTYASYQQAGAEVYEAMYLPSYVDLTPGPNYILDNGAFSTRCGILRDTLRGHHLVCFDEYTPSDDPIDEASPPSTVTILYTALAQTTISGSGLTVQPGHRGVVGIPQLVHAAAPTQTRTPEVFGRAVTINLEATSFSFNFGDGTPPLVTTKPGASYPDMTNQHDWLQAQEGVVVSLTTTWTAHLTNPFTGENLTLENALTTYEVSAPFNVTKAQIHLTDTAEELAGH